MLSLEHYQPLLGLEPACQKQRAACVAPYGTLVLGKMSLELE